MRDDSAQILFQSSLLEALVSNFGMDRLCPLFDVVYPAFSLPTTASLPLQGALKDGFGEAELNYGDWWARMLTNNGYSPYCRNLRRKMVTVVSPEMGSCRSEEERPCFAWAKRGEFPRP